MGGGGGTTCVYKLGGRKRKAPNREKGPLPGTTCLGVYYMFAEKKEKAEMQLLCNLYSMETSTWDVGTLNINHLRFPSGAR